MLKSQANEAQRRAAAAAAQRDSIESISKQNRSYTRCLGEVFAKYTRDGIPITNLDLDTCTVDSQTQATNDTTTGGTSPSGGAVPQETPQAQPQATPSSPGNSGNNGNNNNNGQANNAQREPLRVLGIPTCVPFSNVCVRQ